MPHGESQLAQRRPAQENPDRNPAIHDHLKVRLAGDDASDSTLETVAGPLSEPLAGEEGRTLRPQTDVDLLTYRLIRLNL